MSEEEKQDIENRDDILAKLVKIETNQCWMMKTLSNHLRHHWAVQVVLLTFIGGLITALVIALI